MPIRGVTRGFVVQQAIRWVCLVFLLGALVSFLPTLSPKYADTATLLQDVRAGRTGTVFLGTSSADSVEVVWSDGYAAWKRTTFYKVFADSPLGDRVPAQATGAYGSVTVTVDQVWSARQQLTSALSQAAAGRGQPSVQDRTFSAQSSREVFFFELVEPSFLVASAAVLWVVLFLTMLFTSYHPYANRWAWFWLFTIGGGAAGPLLYLWNEPEPLKARPWRPQNRRLVVREPMTGGTGCMLSLLVGALVVFAGAGISYLGTKAAGW